MAPGHVVSMKKTHICLLLTQFQSSSPHLHLRTFRRFMPKIHRTQRSELVNNSPYVKVSKKWLACSLEKKKKSQNKDSCQKSSECIPRCQKFLPAMSYVHSILKVRSSACLLGQKRKHSKAGLGTENSPEDAANLTRSACCTAGRRPGCPSGFSFSLRWF